MVAAQGTVGKASFLTLSLRSGTLLLIVALLSSCGRKSDNSASPPIVPPDTTPPSSINDLLVTGGTATSATLQWTATGDDGSIGIAATYDIRYSTSLITETNWGSALPASVVKTPSPAGTNETYVLDGLSPETRYFIAIRALDAAGNPSGLSNIGVVTTQYNPPPLPSSPTSLAVWSWGSGGQVGDGTDQNRSVPVQLLGLSGVASLSCGNSHTLALLWDGTVKAWGKDFEGELGDGLRYSHSALSPSDVRDVRDAVAVSAGYRFSVALRSNGTVLAWGYNGSCRLGNGQMDSVARPTPVVIPDGTRLSGVVAISAGGEHCLARLSDGTIRAWGSNSSGQLGKYTGGGYASVIVEKSSGVPLDQVISIAAGWGHSVALLAGGTIRTWGNNAAGSLGNGTTTSTWIPVDPGLTGVVQIAAAGPLTMALINDGTIRIWGGGRLSPVIVNQDGGGPLSGVIQVACGSEHFVALLADGTARAWGRSAEGQLGNGNPGLIYSTPQVVQGLSGIVSIFAGGNNTTALVQSPLPGAFLLQSPISGAIDVPVKPTFSWTASQQAISYRLQISTNDDFSNMILNQSGIVDASYTVSSPLPYATYLWWRVYADNISGSTLSKPISSKLLTELMPTSPPLSFELYGPVNGSVNTPVRPSFYWQPAVGAVTYSLEVSTTFSFDAPDISLSGLSVPFARRPAPLQPDTYYYWRVYAENAHGITIGNGAPRIFKTANVPTGNAIGWGRGMFLGAGADPPISNYIPVPINGISGAIEVAGGLCESVWVKNDGTVWTAGENSWGELGTGSPSTVRLVPVQVVKSGGSGYLTGTVSVAAGYHFALALLEDGTVWAWGRNDYGQLGDGTTIHKYSPVRVIGLANVIAIAAGSDYAYAINRDGTVSAWGMNAGGALGNGHTYPTYNTIPVKVANEDGYGQLDGVVAIDAGQGFAVALKGDGRVVAWGDGTLNKNGSGNGCDCAWPMPVLDMSGPIQLQGFIDIAAGYEHSLALSNDGTIWAWGNNQVGQLGNGTNNSNYMTTHVIGPGPGGYLSGVVSISGGGQSSFALINDGTVRSWGQNTDGVLGRSFITYSYSPGIVQDEAGVGYLGAIRRISAGNTHCLVIR